MLLDGELNGNSWHDGKGTEPIRQIYANATGGCAIGYQHLNANASVQDCEIKHQAKC